MRTPKTALAVLAILIAGVGLTGCSIGFTPDGARATQLARPTATPTADPTEASPTIESKPDDSSATESPTAVGTTITAARERLRASANRVSCPGGTLDVSSTAAVVRLDEPCDDLTVSGTGAVVFADTVGTLTVAAPAAVVAVESATTVTITEEAVGAVVGWSDGQPSVADHGTASVVGPIGED